MGLGLDCGAVRLERTTKDWFLAGLARLGPLVTGVEQIGISSVDGLLAKPIVDLRLLGLSS